MPELAYVAAVIGGGYLLCGTCYVLYCAVGDFKALARRPGPVFLVLMLWPCFIYFENIKKYDDDDDPLTPFM